MSSLTLTLLTFMQMCNLALTLSTLKANIGRINAASNLTLQAGTGIIISNDLLMALPGSTLTLQADSDGDGAGVLTLSSSKTNISNIDGAIIITASDVDLAGGIKGTESEP